MAELREVAGDRSDLLAETAGLAIGASEGEGPEYQARGQAIAELCRLAGAAEYCPTTKSRLLPPATRYWWKRPKRTQNGPAWNAPSAPSTATKMRTAQGLPSRAAHRPAYRTDL